MMLHYHGLDWTQFAQSKGMRGLSPGYWPVLMPRVAASSGRYQRVAIQLRGSRVVHRRLARPLTEPRVRTNGSPRLNTSELP